MKYLILLMLLGCKTTVDYRHWDWCLQECGTRGLKKAGHHLLGNKCCECLDGKVIVDPGRQIYFDED